jgi:predicted amidohydrolase
MTDQLRLSIIQAPIEWERWDANFYYFNALLYRVSGKTDIAVLPETFSTGFTMNVEEMADVPDGFTVCTLKEWAKKFDTALAGSFIVKANRRYYNRGFFITPEGEATYYDKRHLFRMAGESSHFTPGNKQVIVAYRGWNICLQLCYDLRFPVWSRNVNNAYDLLIYPANWPESRIQAWNALLPARAVENLAYVCGVNRTGTDVKGVVYKGRSAVYSPKGEKILNAGAYSEIVRTCTLLKSDLKTLRKKFPAWLDADAFTLKKP